MACENPHHVREKPATKFCSRYPTTVMAPRAATPCDTDSRYRPAVRPAARKSTTLRMKGLSRNTPPTMATYTATRIVQSRAEKCMRSVRDPGAPVFGDVRDAPVAQGESGLEP